METAYGSQRTQDELLAELTGNDGFAGEFLTYMELCRLPQPRRLLWGYRFMAEGISQAEVDLLLMLPGGLFVIEVKTNLKSTGETVSRNRERVKLLRAQLRLTKKDPIYSLVVFYNEREDKLAWFQDLTWVVQARYLRTTVEWLAARKPRAFSQERITGFMRELARPPKEPARRPRSRLRTAPKLQPKQGPPHPPDCPDNEQTTPEPLETLEERKDDTPMVYRIYTARRAGFGTEAAALLREWREQLHLTGLEGLEILNRYDVEGLDGDLLRRCVPTVFSEPQTDRVLDELPAADHIFAAEFLPGQYDQRADSCAQCIQIVSGGQRPAVRTARVFLLTGQLRGEELTAAKKSVINPVESREASLELPKTLALQSEPPAPVESLTGFLELEDAGLAKLLTEYGLAMDLDDLRFCRDYFRSERRNPTVTELRVIDTYWSDHCRHTTFLTQLDSVRIDDPRIRRSFERYQEIKRELGRSAKPDTLMEIATEGMRHLRKIGKLPRLDESEEINACTVTMDVPIRQQDGTETTEPWLFLFKNETHNHPTEIEPFGGAATCIGGAIRDPLSGRGYVYQAMRVTGAADPTDPVEATLPGKLPQRKIVVTAAQGYSSYGNQIGLATGLVDELYHPGYAAKRMEIGAVVAAVPQGQVRRERPVPGDRIILLGGRTGRDGCGGATGSSKSHTLSSLEQCGAEVQKGNAPEERKLQRLFRNPQAAGMIKRCNDFGAGGVSVAIGELCDGLIIDLDAVPKKYEGLDGTELAISESQERMAVVVEAGDAAAFLRLADEENLEATEVAVVAEAPRMVMRWQGKTVVDLSRQFLNSNGAEKHARAEIPLYAVQNTGPQDADFGARLRELAGSLAVCSRRGLAERFDSTIGAGTVLMPFGGRRQQSPTQVMAALIPLEQGDTSACSVMSYGFDPSRSAVDPYAGAYAAVVESLAKLAAAGCPLDQCYLTFQEYFERITAPERWGKPLAALLGALQAQLDFGVAAIGGKDSMSGSFGGETGRIDVPPTLVSFAAALGDARDILPGEFQSPGNRVILAAPTPDEYGLPEAKQAKEIFRLVHTLAVEGKLRSARAITAGGVAEAILKMGLGNRLGFAFDGAYALPLAFTADPGGILLELSEENVPAAAFVRPVGKTMAAYEIQTREDSVPLAALEALYEAKLESVFPMQVPDQAGAVPVVSHLLRSGSAPAMKIARMRVLIPVFPGTNCEVDTARAFERAGAEAEILVVNNCSAQGLAEAAERARKALERSQILFLPGGFSGGDEPDGSGKFITAFLRNPALTEAVMALLEQRGGLVGGICNGFQALIKLGLLPYGKICDMTPDCPTLTFNTIGRHQSKLVQTRIASVLSPWLSRCEPGEIHLVPISHGEGRFVCPEPLLAELAAAGQIATQYVNLQGEPTMEIQYNPNGSVWAVEGITSPDGRVFGKMGHTERVGPLLYRNVPGETDNQMFRAAVEFFQ
ncbi:MAG: phosphoribosylformylglycinamidine synthase [Oscillospiraceae bacterium]|jgi:phosphoribosylformylglycinamidine synthase|nr:phosphoribosylformylglycinamidine synthase [Oscillospiraceae bacterium]